MRLSKNSKKRKIIDRRKITLFIIFLSGILFSAFVFYLVSSSNAELQKKETMASAQLDPEVYKVPGNDYPRGLNLIFVSDGYLSWNEFESDANNLLSELKSYEPWKSFERYNIYYIRPNEIDLCGVKTENERHPTLRCSAEGINSYLNKLEVSGHFKVVVLSRRNFESWANVARVQNSAIFFSLPNSPQDQGMRISLGIQFAHLFGHAFGLKDEEIYSIAKANSSGKIPDGPNCAPDAETAEKWWGHLVVPNGKIGYFKGCGGDADFIKPTKGSLMNLNELEYFEPSYGPVSEGYLRKILHICFSKPGTQVSDSEFFNRYPEFLECVS